MADAETIRRLRALVRRLRAERDDAVATADAAAAGRIADLEAERDAALAAACAVTECAERAPVAGCVSLLDQLAHVTAEAAALRKQLRDWRAAVAELIGGES